MSNTYNENHVVTLGMAESLVLMAVESMKAWTTANVDKTELMTHVKAQLDLCNREVIGNTAAEKLQALQASIPAMVRAFSEAGYQMDNIKTKDFAQLISTLTANSGVYIEDANGLRWTAAQWSYEKEQQGHDPAQFQGIVVTTPIHTYYIGSRNYGPSMFGTMNHTIPNLMSVQDGFPGSPIDGTYNSRKIIAATNPERCEAARKLTHFEGMTDLDLTDKDVVFFPDRATLDAWANSMGLPILTTIGESMIYAIPHASESDSWKLLYHKNGGTSINFQERESIAPYVDSSGQQGCTALNFCWSHKEYDSDTMLWRLGSKLEFSLTYLNLDAINECRIAGGFPEIPKSDFWCGLQSNNTGAYYFSLASGNFSTHFKNTQCWSVPIASCRKAQ